tara:strand:- start:74 stop:289 length:216 start_codon:yes stop_codon:yes gene_type:complete
MKNNNLTEEQLVEICEDAFVNVKEACMRLQERTQCSNKVVIKMLNNVSEYYSSQSFEEDENSFKGLNDLKI